jgi:hypothetical protein
MQNAQWSHKPLTVLHPVTDAAMTALQRHILQLAPSFNFETDAARISKFPTLKAELSQCTSQGLYIWQYSRSPPALPACQLLTLQKPQLLIKWLQRTKTRNSVG